MIIRDCFFCKREFRGEPDDTSCDHCRNVVVAAVRGNGRLRDIIINTLMNDENFINEMAKKIFQIPASDVGLGGPGSLAQFFRKKRKKKTKKAT